MGIQKAVFLDRDGTLNLAYPTTDGSTRPPRNLQELEIFPDAVEACALMIGCGFRLFCVTNQPDVARGKQKEDSVHAINTWVARSLFIEDVFTCFHDEGQCECRKPKPGLILQAAEKHGIYLPDSFMVGDRLTDMEAGRAAGCKCILVNEHVHTEENGFLRAGSLLGAARWIQSLTCRQKRGEK